MLTIDADGDSDNGIQISSTLREGAQGQMFSFDMPVAEFENNFDVMDFIGQMTNTSQMLGTEIAMGHFQTTLEDSDSTNGIHIDGMTRGAAYGNSVDFDMPMANFESDPELADFINQMPGMSNMVGIREAQEHFQGTLDNMGGGNMGSGMGGGNMGMNN